MNRRHSAAALFLAALAAAPVATLPGCQTPQPGVKSAFGSQFAVVRASTEEATEAAAETLEEMGLTDVTATSTEIDGEITGTTDDGTRVEVYVAQEDQGRAEISVTVGALGDAATGTAIVARIREKLTR